MNKNLVLSFFDYTGNAVREYARQGMTCICYDLQHGDQMRIEKVGTGEILYIKADLGPDSEEWSTILGHIQTLCKRQGVKVHMVFGFPPCTDLAGSGAKHWAAKREADPLFQHKAAAMARAVALTADLLGAPYCIENPRGALSTLWRKPDYAFDPCDFGGYLPENDQHPEWPQYIAPRDAYTKATNLWTGNGFKMPVKKRVEPEILEKVAKSGAIIRGSRQFMKLGGKGLKTKNIRNATPRGFALAVTEAN